ncbi:MAG TPA: DUF4340 domain-containing protein [Anaerolineales bacterium]|jgi:hypothetical protein|nr:DUF4340 domain-containing protein [Anaerolineales bacterium]
MITSLRTGTFDRANQLLGGLLVAQVVLAAVVFWPRVTVADGGLLFAGQAEAEIVVLAITDGDGKRVALAKDGQQWVLPEADAFPADGDRVAPLLRKIEQLRTGRLVTVTEGSHVRLQVAEQKFNRKMLITWSDGAQNTLLLGSTAGAGATHFRLLEDDEVYLTADLTPWEANTAASNYIDTQIFNVSRDAITAITLQNLNGSFTFVKRDEKWTWPEMAADEMLDDTVLNGLLTQVSSVHMIAPLGKAPKPSYGLDQPLATATITAEVGDALQQHVLRVGAERGSNYVFSASGAEYYVSVSAYTAGHLIDKTHADFVQASPEEEAS